MLRECEDLTVCIENLDFQENCCGILDHLSESNNFHDNHLSERVVDSRLKPYSNNVSSLHMNTCSIHKHYDEISSVLYSSWMDILGISEAKQSAPAYIPGYTYYHKEGANKGRGGVGMYVKDGIPVKVIDLCADVTELDVFFIEVTCRNESMAVGVISKPPQTPYSYSDYVHVHEILTPILSSYQHHVVMGDLNMDSSSHSHMLSSHPDSKYSTLGW